MPDILTILLALLGIFGVGLALSAINLVTNATKFIAVSLLVAFVILMTNRTFSFTPPRDSSTADRPAIDFPSGNGRDLISGFFSGVGNFSDSLDAFVYGPQAKIGWQTMPEKLPLDQKTLSSERTISERRSSPPENRPVDRTPVSPTPRQTAPAQRPVSAWW
jgi:cell division protein FtsN